MTRIRRGAPALLLVITTGGLTPGVLTSCSHSMPDIPDHLVGAWRRASDATCAAQYPIALRFEASGLYRGATEPPGQFSTWDVGTWRVDGGALAISTANDAVVRYPFTLAGDVLQITDPAGCRFDYRRAV